MLLSKFAHYSMLLDYWPPRIHPWWWFLFHLKSSGACTMVCCLKARQHNCIKPWWREKVEGKAIPAVAAVQLEISQKIHRRQGVGKRFWTRRSVILECSLVELKLLQVLCCRRVLVGILQWIYLFLTPSRLSEFRCGYITWIALWNHLRVAIVC